MRYACDVYMRFQSGKDRQTNSSDKETDGVSSEQTGCAHRRRPTDASGLRGLLNQFGDDLTSVVDLADASTRAIHWDLEEFLVVR